MNLFLLIFFHNSSGIPSHNRIGRNIFGYHAASSDDSIFADSYSAQNRGTGSNRCASPDKCRYANPICLGLQLPLGRSGARIFVINKCYIVTHKDIVIYVYTFADKGMAGYFTILSNFSALLDFNESAYFRIVANFTAI